MKEHAYKYTFTHASLAPAATAAPTIQITKEVERFTATAISAVVFDVATGITVSNEQLPMILANLKPSADEAGICNVATPLSLLAGTGREPHLLDKPVEFEGNTSPVLELNNFSSDKTYKVYVTLHGYRSKN